MGEPLEGLPRWVAGVLPLCQNLTALHLTYVETRELPALPLLVHLILDSCMFTPVLVASLRGLTRLETLWVSGRWGPESSVWDMRACTRLRRLYFPAALAADMAFWGRALSVPTACAVALDFQEMRKGRPWLMQLGERVADLRFYSLRLDQAALHISYLHAPQLSQLRHLTMCLYCGGADAGSLCVAHLLSVLPQSVESLHFECPDLWSEQAMVVVPASLRALRMKGVCKSYVCRSVCLCDPSQRKQDFTFGLHAGLERLCLLLWEVRVGLECLEAGAPAGLRELVVQAWVVDMDAQLAAEVAQRGRMLERCDVLDREWLETGSCCASSADSAHRAGPGAHGKKVGGGPRAALALGLHMRCMRRVPGAGGLWGCRGCALQPVRFEGVWDAWLQRVRQGARHIGGWAMGWVRVAVVCLMSYASCFCAGCRVYNLATDNY